MDQLNIFNLNNALEPTTTMAMAYPMGFADPGKAWSATSLMIGCLGPGMLHISKGTSRGMDDATQGGATGGGEGGGGDGGGGEGDDMPRKMEYCNMLTWSAGRTPQCDLQPQCDRTPQCGPSIQLGTGVRTLPYTMYEWPDGDMQLKVEKAVVTYEGVYLTDEKFTVNEDGREVVMRQIMSGTLSACTRGAKEDLPGSMEWIVMLDGNLSWKVEKVDRLEGTVKGLCMSVHVEPQQSTGGRTHMIHAALPIVLSTKGDEYTVYSLDTPGDDDVLKDGLGDDDVLKVVSDGRSCFSPPPGPSNITEMTEIPFPNE